MIIQIIKGCFDCPYLCETEETANCVLLIATQDDTNVLDLNLTKEVHKDCPLKTQPLLLKYEI